MGLFQRWLYPPVRGKDAAEQAARAAAGLPHGQLATVGGFRVGDRVSCTRTRYEGEGTIRAISNDLGDLSGGTKVYPTLYVDLDSGGGDWYSGYALKKAE